MQKSLIDTNNLTNCDISLQDKEFYDRITVDSNLNSLSKDSYDNDLLVKGFCDFGSSKSNTKIRKRIQTKKFQCEVCHKKFFSRGHLDDHVFTHTGEKPHTCDICSRKFTQKSHFKRHLLTHTGERRFDCPICLKKFTYKHHFLEHLCTHTGEKPFVCEICGKGFTRKTCMKIHMLTHTTDKPFVCEVCRKSFSFRSGLESHMTAHTGVHPHECAICKKGFRTKRGLRNHDDKKCVGIDKNRAEIKSYECKKCQKNFNCKKDLWSHIQDHKQSKSFICHYCQKGFAKPSNLTKHLCIHSKEIPDICDIVSDKALTKYYCNNETNIKPLKCNTCGKIFSTRKAFNSHLKIHKPVKYDSFNDIKRHNSAVLRNNALNIVKLESPVEVISEERNTQCKICGKAFTEHSLLYDHMLNHVPVKESYSTKFKLDFECELPNNEFSETAKLDADFEYNQRHSFQCELCEEVFLEQFLLKEHMLSHRDKESDSLKINIDLECIKKINFQCKFCQKLFDEQYLLNEHVKVTHETKDSDLVKSEFYIECNLPKTILSHTEVETYNKVCNQKNQFPHEAYQEVFIEKHVSTEHVVLHKTSQADNIINCDKKEVTDTIKLNHKIKNKYSFKCEVCQKIFKHKRSFNDHVLIHTGEKPYVCGICNKAFNHRKSLKMHLLIHTGEKRFTCDVCSKMFTFKHHFKDHMRGHTGEKPYVCKTCGKGFSRSGYLKRHPCVHTKREIHECQICYKSFYSKTAFEKHMHSST